jgi:hypothetical protein
VVKEKKIHTRRGNGIHARGPRRAALGPARAQRRGQRAVGGGGGGRGRAGGLQAAGDGGALAGGAVAGGGGPGGGRVPEGGEAVLLWVRVSISCIYRWRERGERRTAQSGAPSHHWARARVATPRRERADVVFMVR